MLSTITMSGEFVLNGCVWLALRESLCLSTNRNATDFVCFSALVYLVTNGAILFKELRLKKTKWNNYKRIPLVCLAFVINIYYSWLIKITKVTKVKQMLQISHSEVILAICLSWMITINRAYVYKKFLNTRSIMTWLYCKSSSADII